MYRLTPKDYILLEREDQPGLLVGKDRLRPCDVYAWHEDYDSDKHLGNMSWDQALELNLKHQHRTLNPREFFDFLNYLEEGRQNIVKVRNGEGDLVSEKELGGIVDAIIGMRSPYRAEWLDASYYKEEGIPSIRTYHELHDYNGREVLLPTVIEPLLPYIHETQTLVELFDMNEQGMPIRKAKQPSKQAFEYSAPDFKNAFAMWIANPSRRFFRANVAPHTSGEGIGVRPVRLAL